MMTFDQACKLWDERPKGAKSVPLKAATANLRLVALDDRFAIQLANTYLLRISEDGNYVVNLGTRPTATAAVMLTIHGPFTCYYLDGKVIHARTGKEVKSLDVYNSKGEKQI